MKIRSLIWSFTINRLRLNAWIPRKSESLEVENRAGSPTRKIGQNMSWMDSAAGGNQFEALRELLGDYPSSDCNSVGGDSVIPKPAFDVVAGARS